MDLILNYDNFVHALAGSVASGTAMTIFYPLDTVRSRLQLEDTRKSKNTLATLHDLIQEQGVSSLYDGLEPTLYALFTSGFVYFYSFHGLRRYFGEKTALKDLTLGALAGAINVLITTPMWVVSTRIRMRKSKKLSVQLESSHEIPPNPINNSIDYDCITDGMIKIVKRDGLGALWSGTLPSLVLVTNPAMQFMIFELLKRNLKQILEKRELSPHHVFALGAISKSISTVISYPLQVVQSKKRYGSPDVKSKSIGEILRELVETGALYKGMETKLTQTVMTTALMYVFYERIYSFVTKVSKSI